MPVDVLCVGHAAYDVSAFVDAYPAENSKCVTHESLAACGGPAANAAWLLAFWGLRTAFAGLVGQDVYGRRIRDEFLAVNADISQLELRPGHDTPLSWIVINKQNGSRTIVNRKPADAAFRGDEQAFATMSPRLLLFDGHELEASLVALRAVPGAVSILDAGSWRDGTAALAGKVNYLAASERFALQATGMKSLRDAPDRRNCLAKLREWFATIVIVTLGEDGLIFDDGGGFQQIPAFPAQAVDTTAAGDIFHGAFAFALAQTMSLWEGLRFASMAASLSVRRPGGRASIPTLTAVQEAMAHV